MEKAPRADKAAIVEEVRQRFADAQAVLVTEYRGLDVRALAEVRSGLRNADCVYKVYKNTLVRLAVAHSAPPGVDELLRGPTAFAFCGSDPGAAAKVLRDFAVANDALVIKGGILADTLLDGKSARDLADLPSREELLAGLAGGLAAPLSSLASMMNGLLGELGGLIDALADRRGETPDADSADA